MKRSTGALRTNAAMMKTILRLGFAITVVALFCVSSAFADNTASMILTSPGNNVYDNAVYIGPYYATIGSSTNVPVICDDYVDNSYVPESWLAYVTPENNLTLNNQGATSVLKFGDNPSLYNEMSWLATQLVANQSNTAAADAIQFAIWDLGVQSQGSSITDLPLPAGTSSWMSNASAFANTTFANVTIYSFDSCTTTVSSPCSATNPPQEFLTVNTPEPSTILLLVLGLGGLLMLWQRRRNAAELAL
jgi:PEP-CTERM motif